MIVRIYGMIREMDDDVAVMLIKEGVAYPALKDEIEKEGQKKVDIEV